ncbi:50S ribosomal protein L13 [Candidatus Gottesmanbacteria bacterium]|nr:50S ribosomal protein L13 [Candidatus Gottesmanbacteria bacterium]
MNTPKKLTRATKASEIKHGWRLFDVKGKVLGRITSDIAQALMGKSKPYYTKTLDCGDYVVVVNAKEVAVTGKKEADKMYGNFSGFPGGLKEKALWQIRAEKPSLIITHAVKGMLPKNKLRDRLMTRLYVYADETHPYIEKFEAKK